MDQNNMINNVPKARIYGEIKASLVRTKNQMIDDILATEDDLDLVIEKTSRVIDDYEQTRVLMKSWVFDGKLPDGYVLPGDNDDDETDEQDLVDEDSNEILDS